MAKTRARSHWLNNRFGKLTLGDWTGLILFFFAIILIFCLLFILDAPTTLVKTAVAHGKITGSGTAGLAVAHYGSTKMISFRYRLKNLPMKIAEQSFTAEGVSMPAGSFIVTGSAADLQSARAAVESLGLTAVALSAAP